MAKKTSIGGQALIEGIMMRGPEKTAMAVRNPEGEIVLEMDETKGKDRGAFFKLPVVRGLFNMYDSLSSGYKYLMRSAEIAGVDDAPKKKDKEPTKWDQLFEKLLMPIAMVLAVVLALGLFMYVPMLLWKGLASLIPAIADSYFLRACFEGILRIIVFIGYVWATSLMKDIRRTYMYHGAEHKTIFCYEHGKELTVENVRREGRFHPRCGTSFLILMLIVSIFISFLIDPLFYLIAGTVPHLAIRTAIRLLLLPLIMGLGYELIKFAGRHDNLFTRIVSAPGMWLQHITVLEPEDDMIECAIKAFCEVIPEEEKMAESNSAESENL